MVVIGGSDNEVYGVSRTVDSRHDKNNTKKFKMRNSRACDDLRLQSNFLVDLFGNPGMVKRERR